MAKRLRSRLAQQKCYRLLEAGFSHGVRKGQLRISPGIGKEGARGIISKDYQGRLGGINDVASYGMRCLYEAQFVRILVRICRSLLLLSKASREVPRETSRDQERRVTGP